MDGIVYNIQRMSTKDGPGLRTTVFLKGCPLHCPWCSNPESQSFKPQLMFFSNLCVGCGVCERVCPNGAVVKIGDVYNRDRRRRDLWRRRAHGGGSVSVGVARRVHTPGLPHLSGYLWCLRTRALQEDHESSRTVPLRL